VTKNDERRPSLFEMKILRRLCGLIYEKGQWMKRCNREFEDLYDEPNMFNVIKYGRLRLAGRAARMNENELPNKNMHKHWKSTRT
jgi:hypothetical protein